MSENARKRSTPESHLIEERRSEAPARAWGGHVTITSDEGTVTVPGVWHLQLPHESLPTGHHARETFALPAADDGPAWRRHLERLVTLQVPGMQLRVRTTSGDEWHTLEYSAPSTPRSVVQIDREGLRAIVGSPVTVTLSVHSGSE